MRKNRLRFIKMIKVDEIRLAVGFPVKMRPPG
jgi:hypothetical protein